MYDPARPVRPDALKDLLDQSLRQRSALQARITDKRNNGAVTHINVGHVGVLFSSAHCIRNTDARTLTETIQHTYIVSLLRLKSIMIFDRIYAWNDVIFERYLYERYFSAGRVRLGFFRAGTKCA